MGNARRGVALVVVLFLTAILMLIVLEFVHSMQVYATIGSHARYDVQLRGALHAGVAVAERLLLEDMVTDLDNDAEIDALDEDWAGEIPTIALEGVTAEVAIVDEAGKFPLPTLVTYTFENGAIVGSRVDADRRQQLETLFEELDIDRDLIDVLVDWLDTDDDAEPRGAETPAYADDGRACRNGPLTSIHELELLRGFTPAIVWGDPEDEDALGLADVCTVHPRPDGLVNANTASEPVLLAVLQADDLARRVSSERDRDPFFDRTDLNDRVGDSSVSDVLTCASGTWTVQVTARTTHANRPLTMRVRAVLRRGRDSASADTATDTGETLFLTGAAADAAADAGRVWIAAWKETR